MKVLEILKKRSSSMNENIRNARFVPVEVVKTENFKYGCMQKLNRVLHRHSKAFIHFTKKLSQGAKLKLSFVDLQAVKRDSFVWGVDVFIEGITANFSATFLFGADFTIFTVFAYGIVIKQGISIYWRLKNGDNRKLPEKNTEQ